MRDGLRFSVAINEFVVAAICITVISCSVGYFAHAHRPVPAVASVPLPVTSCQTSEPTITIEQTFYIPVPKVVVVTPETEVTPDQDDEQKPLNENFQVRTPIITDALQQPMPR